LFNFAHPCDLKPPEPSGVEITSLRAKTGPASLVSGNHGRLRALFPYLTEEEKRMTLKMDSKLETELTPEEISDDDSLTSDEKLERIKDMKSELERQTARGSGDLAQVEARMASLNLAISRVKNR
jgi:hypothetical protein